MTDPKRTSDEELAKAALRDRSSAMERIDPVWTDPYAPEVYPAVDPDSPVVHQERLFSRKVLTGWALAALVVVFIIRVILPIAFESAKDAVITSMKQSHATRVSTPAVVPTPPPSVPEVPAAPAAPKAPTAAPSAGAHPAPVQTPETKSRK